MNEIKALMLGFTVVLKFNQGISRDRGVFDLGCPFWVPFWASKKVQSTYTNFQITGCIL